MTTEQNLAQLLRPIYAPRILAGDEQATLQRVITACGLPTTQRKDGTYLNESAIVIQRVWCAAVEWACKAAAHQLAAAVAAPSDADMDELRRAICGIRVVGAMDGYDVIRRDSVIDLIDRRRVAPSAGAATTSDTERLDFMADEECRIEVMAGPLYRLHWPDRGEWQREWSKTPREAIDAALRATQQEGGQ